MKNIAFYVEHLSERGTEVGIFNYAKGNRDILNNNSVLFVKRNSPYHHPKSIEKFYNEFDSIIPVENPKDASNQIRDHGNFDGVFFISSQKNNVEYSFDGTPRFINQTGIISHSDRWGEKYSYVSDWQRKHCGGPEDFPVLNRPVVLTDTKENLRKELSIPDDAIVLSRTGGADTWNLPFANDSCLRALEENKNLFLLFQNTPNAPTHERVIHCDSSVDIEFKTRFINTCDAMLHCRFEGESFGVAVAEFSSMNKPIITYGLSRERGHLDYLGEKAITYSSPDELVSVMVNFEPNSSIDWNCYRHCSFENVVQQFNKIYLEEL